MKKKIIFTYCLILNLTLLTGNLYAGIADILIGGADAYTRINEANHWAAFMASSVLGICFIAIGKMQPTTFKLYAIARAFIIIVAGTFCIILILHEWWPAVIIIADFFINMLESIFEFSKDFTSGSYEYITEL